MERRHPGSAELSGDIIDRLSGKPPVFPAKLREVPLPEPPPAGRPAREEREEGVQEKETAGVREREAAAEGEQESGKLLHERDGLFHVYRTGGISYRVGGVKSLFVSSLRVNLRASDGKTSYYDSLDLYAARSRTGFCEALHRVLGCEPARAERDLVMILEDLEGQRDRELARGRAETGKAQMSAKEREAGLELLRDPRLFDRITEDLCGLGYVGEDLNKQLLYIAASSRKLDDPVSVMILSQSASGKSFLVDCVRKLMPPEEVVAVTSLSDQALNYVEDLTHKFLVLGEAVHGEVVEHQIREMLSGKELSRLVTVKDPQTGAMQSSVRRRAVIVSCVMGTTSYRINPENASRCFLINADESREQTQRIHAKQREKYSLERMRSGEAQAEGIIRAHHAAQRLLEKKAVVNGFAAHLEFPTALMRMRRDHERFLDLMAAVCFLRQYQKKSEYENGRSFVRCDIEDYRVAHRIMVEGVLSSTMRELPSGAQLLYESMRALARERSAREKIGVSEVSMTQREIREYTGLAQTWVRTHLHHLAEYEYISTVRGGRERSRGYYRIKADEDIVRADLSMIPAPGRMERLMRGGPA
jgi:hypothetical protein